jgi:hypothetical protein
MFSDLHQIEEDYKYNITQGHRIRQINACYAGIQQVLVGMQVTLARFENNTWVDPL